MKKVNRGPRNGGLAGRSAMVAKNRNAAFSPRKAAPAGHHYRKHPVSGAYHLIKNPKRR